MSIVNDHPEWLFLNHIHASRHAGKCGKRPLHHSPINPHRFSNLCDRSSVLEIEIIGKPIADRNLSMHEPRRDEMLAAKVIKISETVHRIKKVLPRMVFLIHEEKLAWFCGTPRNIRKKLNFRRSVPLKRTMGFDMLGVKIQKKSRIEIKKTVAVLDDALRSHLENGELGARANGIAEKAVDEKPPGHGITSYILFAPIENLYAHRGEERGFLPGGFENGIHELDDR